MNKILISIAILLISSFPLLAASEADCANSQDEQHQLEKSLAPILNVLKDQNNQLFQTLFAVLEDISAYQKLFNDKNDQFKMAYTFYLLKSFADLKEQSISSEDITTILSIIKEKYKFDIPPVAFEIVKKIKHISVIHNRDGSRSIKLTSTDGKPIAIDLSKLIPHDPKKKNDVKMNWFIIQSGAEIKFSEYGKSNSHEKVNSFLRRSTITQQQNLISEDAIARMKQYLTNYRGEIAPSYIDLKGFTLKFDLAGVDVNKADLRGGLLLPKFKDGKNQDAPNFYIGLTNIKYGILNLDAELPL